MSINPKNIVATASTVSLLSSAKIRGFNTYSIGTNLISWDDSSSYTIAEISSKFGITDSDMSPNLFRVGDSFVNAYDYGLLFSCFAAIVAASAEIGSAVPVFCDVSSNDAIQVVWFGCNAIVYSRQKNFIMPIKSTCIQDACKLSKVNVDNFVSSVGFVLSREGDSFIVMSRDNAFVCSFQIPAIVKRAYSALFENKKFNGTNSISLFDSSWEEGSGLGELINSTRSSASIEDTLKQYENEVSLANVIMRSDLLFTPNKRYTSVEEFIGSLCYSDKGEISLAVNFRNQLFIYRPWFSGDNESEIMVDSGPQFQNFFNVTEECTAVERFASTVTARPLSPAQFDVGVFNKIKDAFFALDLPRLQLASAFGRIVIPESVMVQGLRSLGEAIYCIVPVGAIGKNIICVTPDGNLYTRSELSCTSDLYYDITEVLNNVL